MRNLSLDYTDTLGIHKNILPSSAQWASEVVDFSSQHNDSNRPSRHILGNPKVTSCEPAELTARSNWAPSKRNNRIEYFRVRFAQPVLLPEISVHELVQLRFLRKIILWDPDGKGAEYEVLDPLAGQRQCLGFATFRIDEHTKPVNRSFRCPRHESCLRLERDTLDIAQWDSAGNEIGDAIERTVSDLVDRYARSDYLESRCSLMEDWGEYDVS